MYPRFPWKLVADPVGSMEHILEALSHTVSDSQMCSKFQNYSFSDPPFCWMLRSVDW